MYQVAQAPTVDHEVTEQEKALARRSAATPFGLTNEILTITIWLCNQVVI